MTEPNPTNPGNVAGGTTAAPLADQARQVAHDIKDKASAVTDVVTNTAKEQAEEIGAAAKEALNDAGERISSAVNDQKTAGADYLETVAQAIGRAAEEFEADVPQAAKYIRRAGSQLGDLATSVRDRDLRELVSEVESLARRQPALFFGGAMIAGFAAIRFIKSAPAKNALPDKPAGQNS